MKLLIVKGTQVMTMMHETFQNVSTGFITGNNPCKFSQKKPAADLLEKANLFSGSLREFLIVLCPLHLGQIQPWHFRSCAICDFFFFHVMPWQVYFSNLNIFFLGLENGLQPNVSDYAGLSLISHACYFHILQILL